MNCKLSAICLLLTIGLTTVVGDKTADPAAAVPTISTSPPDSSPEGRQIVSKSDALNQMAFGPGAGVGAGGAAPYPYASLYQNMLSSGLPQTAVSAGSWLSMLRPSQGGRRSSLTNRLKNIMNSFFGRSSAPSFMAQGSNMMPSYAMRQPSLNFGPGGLGAAAAAAGLGAGGLGASGLGAAGLGSAGLGSAGLNFGSNSGNNLMAAAASAYQPIVVPSSASVPSSSGSVGSGSSWNSNWAGSTSTGNNQVANQPISGYYGNSAPSSYQQGSATSGQTYQAAATSYNPSNLSSNYPSSSGQSQGQASGYQGNNQYQRSSSSSFKPIVSNGYSSNLSNKVF
ncbi:hypothetical protein HDE_12257 [Halotydeus destructor]|nr:hypothetical protein HDE_12257 [Halotydeus destructor]